MSRQKNKGKTSQNADSIASKISEDTTVITGDVNAYIIEKAMYDLMNNKHTYSAYLNDNSIGSSTITDRELEDLATNTQNTLSKVLKINSYVRKEINKNDIVGKTYEAIETNVNTKIELSFQNFPENRNKATNVDKARDVIDNFNEMINLESLIAKVVPMVYTEGNYVMYLRGEDTGDYQVDYFPLGVSEVSDYEISGEPVVLLNLAELEGRLKKVNKKDRKGKALFFNKIEDEIKANYPKEVYTAYKNKDQYVKLNPENSGVIRINNLNRRYGVTPMFRALKPSLMIESYKKTDENNNRARGKKIIFQKTRKELFEQNAGTTSFGAVSHAHNELLNSLASNDVSVYSAMPFVESVEYVEPKIEPTQVQNIQAYRNEMASALGIGYTISDKTGVAEISLNQLMKMINKITKQLEKILKKWYKKVLKLNGIDPLYTPNVKIIDSELMENDVKVSLATFFFNQLGISYESLYEMFDLSFEDELRKRQEEADSKIDEVFSPRLTAFTSGGQDTNNNQTNKGGKPKNGKDKDKQEKDQERIKDGDLGE